MLNQTRSLSLLALAMISAPLVAQESTGTLVGTVKTKKGQPLANAEVRITSPSLQGTRTAITDAGGNFRAALLPPGAYTVTVVKADYIAPRATLDISLGQTVRQDLVAAESAASTTVEVIATAATVDKSDVKSSTTITAEFLDQIPRTTRGMDTAALLAPGVTTGVGNRVQIRGGQTSQNRFLLNGSDIADNVFGNTTGRTYYVDDSILESQVIQSPVHARFGNFLGGIIQAITKTGSNEFQGIFRANISRPSWSAVAPMGLRPLGAKPTNAGTGNAEDGLNRSYALWIGGPIVKDKVWFAVSTKLDPTLTAPFSMQSVTGLTTFDGNQPAFGATGLPVVDPYTGKTLLSGAPTAQVDKNTFYELKLTWSINSNHLLELTGNKNKTDQVNRNYTNTFDPDNLVPQTNENSYVTLNYRGLFGNSLALDLRWAKKHQLLQAGGNPTGPDPIRAAYSNGTTYYFQNGIFNFGDGGDNRDIFTWTGNLTWFTPHNDLGSGIFDFGFELLDQRRAAANDQAPHSRIFQNLGRNADGTYRNVAGSTNGYVNLYFTDRGEAITKISSFYVNGVWTFNDRWQALLGGRMDKTEAKDTLGAATISSSRFSPRLQLTYDLKGDQAWVARASFARYVGKLNDGFTNRFGFAGNPVTERYLWSGGTSATLTNTQITNLANYNVTPAGLSSYSGPLSRFVDSSTKAPYTDEVSLGLRHNFKDGSFVGYTYSQRKSKGFFNDFFKIGDEVAVPLRFAAGAAPPVLAERWGTDERLTRDYKSFEIEFSFKLNAEWNFGGNYTYAILRGNGEGSEGNNPPVAGDVIGDWQSVHDNRGRDFSYYAADGYLTGDVRNRARMFLSYANRPTNGTGFYGSLLLNYNGGGDYSLTRTNLFEARVDRNPTNDPNLASIAAQYPNSYTRYFGPRGLGRFNDTFNFDLKMGVDIPVFWRLRWFGEVTVFNVFNHWQLATYATTSVSGASGTTFLATTDPLAGYRAQALPASGLYGGNATGYGTYGPADYVGGRSVVLSTGFRW